MKATTILVILLMMFGLMVILPGVASADPASPCGAQKGIGAEVSLFMPDLAKTWGKGANPTFSVGPTGFSPGVSGACSANDAWTHSPHGLAGDGDPCSGGGPFASPGAAVCDVIDFTREPTALSL